MTNKRNSLHCNLKGFLLSAAVLMILQMNNPEFYLLASIQPPRFDAARQNAVIFIFLECSSVTYASSVCVQPVVHMLSSPSL